MALYPAAALFLLVWLVQTIRDPDRGALVMLAALPFGMFAAVSVSGLSVLAGHLIAALTLFTYAVRRVGGGLDAIRVPPAGIYILLFSAYALFSSIVLVRIFAGEFLVFPMTVDYRGLRLSNAFVSSLKPLEPGNSNIAQAGYILIAALVFVMLADICRRRGAAFVERGLVWAAVANILLALFDMAGLDAVLGFVRTADYSLNNEQTVMGLPRVIGGFAEASTFGTASAVFFGYFGMSFMSARRTRDGVLALLSLIFGMLAFSSTGIAAMIAASLLILLHGGSFLRRGLSRAFAHWLVISVAVLALGLSLAAILTPLLDHAGAIFDELFLQKSESQSGLERGAWALWGFKAFVETWGLGAGAGSLRANGLAAVLLGNVGLPGTLLFLAFLWNALGPSGSAEVSEARRIFLAARVGTLALLSAFLLSATTPDPSLLLMAVTAMAATLRQGMAQEARWQQAYVGHATARALP